MPSEQSINRPNPPAIVELSPVRFLSGCAVAALLSLQPWPAAAGEGPDLKKAPLQQAVPAALVLPVAVSRQVEGELPSPASQGACGESSQPCSGGLSGEVPDFRSLPPGGTPFPSPLETKGNFTFLEDIATPEEIPSGVQLKEEFSERSWRGSRCGIRGFHTVVFREEAVWRRFWEKAMATHSKRLAAVPPVDFDREIVAAVFMGQRDTPGYEVEILSIREQRRGSGEVLMVKYREREPFRGVFSVPFPVRPYHLKVVPLYSGRVIFDKVGKTAR